MKRRADTHTTEKPGLRSQAMMSGYDFSPLYRSALSTFSPGSTFLATAHQNRIIVRSTHNLAIVRTWTLTSLAASTDGVSHAESSSQANARVLTMDEVQWSDDGLYILALCRAVQTIWVFALAEEGKGIEGEVAKIVAGPEGLEGARWAKGGREVIVWSEHDVGDTAAIESHGEGEIGDGVHMR